MKTIFSRSAGHNHLFPAVLFPHLLAPHLSPCWRQIVPASYFLTTVPWLLCIPGAHQDWEEMKGPEPCQLHWGPGHWWSDFFNEHRGQGLERKVGVHRRASTICDWIIKSWVFGHWCSSNTHVSQEFNVALSRWDSWSPTRLWLLAVREVLRRSDNWFLSEEFGSCTDSPHELSGAVLEIPKLHKVVQVFPGPK